MSDAGVKQIWYLSNSPVFAKYILEIFVMRDGTG